MILSYKSCGKLAEIFIIYAFLMIIPPKYLVVLFCAWVYGAESLNIIPWVYSYLRVFFLPSLLSNLMVLTLKLYFK